MGLLAQKRKEMYSYGLFVSVSVWMPVFEI